MITPTDNNLHIVTRHEITSPDCREADFTWRPDEERFRLSLQLATFAMQLGTGKQSVEGALSDFLKSLHVKRAFFGDTLPVDFDGMV